MPRRKARHRVTPVLVQLGQDYYANPTDISYMDIQDGCVAVHYKGENRTTKIKPTDQTASQLMTTLVARLNGDEVQKPTVKHLRQPTRD